MYVSHEELLDIPKGISQSGERTAEECLRLLDRHPGVNQDEMVTVGYCVDVGGSKRVRRKWQRNAMNARGNFDGSGFLPVVIGHRVLFDWLVRVVVPQPIR
jgi:hypothetical protein